jgi:hypothetical protein
MGRQPFIHQSILAPSEGFYDEEFADGTGIKPPGDNAQIVPLMILEMGSDEKREQEPK